MNVPMVIREAARWPAVVLREYEEWGLKSLDLVNPPRRLAGPETPSWPAVEMGVDRRRTRDVPTPSQLLSRLPEGDNWTAHSRRSVGRLWSYFLICEDPQRRFDARDVSTLSHQVSLVRHLLENEQLHRVLIADEVGLGKTVEVGLLLQELLEQQPGLRVLYLTPARLVKNVRREFDRLRLPFRQWSAGDADARLSDPRIIASIHRAVHESNREGVLNAGPWDVLIVDECHHLSDWAPGGGDPREQFKLVRELIARMPDGGRVLFLIGTPHQGHVSRFDNLLNLLRRSDEQNNALSGRGIYRTKDDVLDWNDQPLFPARQVNEPLVFDVGPRYRAWIRHIHDFYRPAETGAIAEARQRAAGWRCAQALQWAASSPHAGLGYLARQALRAGWDLSVTVIQGALAALRPYRGGLLDEPLDQLLRRMRQEIERQASSGDLDDIEEDTGGINDAFGRQLEALLEEGVEIVRREPDGKWRFVKERLLDPASDDKVVLFAQPIETVTAFAHFLERAMGTKPALIIGGQSDRERQAEIDSFTRPGGPQFLVSSRAGGEGINLQVARRLVHIDVPWNPMELEQRVGRVHRFGSRQTVIVDTVVVKDSREADAYRVARERLRLIASTLVEPDRFENVFSRVMTLIPPEELQNVLINEALAPLTGAEQETIAYIVRQGFSRWREFHERFAESQRSIRRLTPGLATWDEVRYGLEKYVGAKPASGYTAQRFRWREDEIEPIDEPASVLTLDDGRDYLCMDPEGAPVWGPQGQMAIPLGLNRSPLSDLVRRLAFPELPSGAAYLRWPEGVARPSHAPTGQFGVVLLVRQSVQTRSLAVWEERGSELYCYVVMENVGIANLVGDDKANLLRGLFDAGVRVRPETAERLVEALEQEESRLIVELRRPEPVELERGIRHVVLPLFAAIVS